MSEDASHSLITNDSSGFSATNGNNVSFVDITYTIQPWSLFTKLPPKKILDHVRYVYAKMMITAYMFLLCYAHLISNSFSILI